MLFHHSCACQVINASPASYEHFQAHFGTQQLLGPRVLVTQTFGIQSDFALSIGELITLVAQESILPLAYCKLLWARLSEV